MMPILHLPGEMMPGQFGPIRRVCLPLQKLPRPSPCRCAGMPSVMQTTSGTPASAASMMASAANGGGTKITVALAPVSFTAWATVSKTGRSRCVRAALAGHHAAHHIGAVGDGLLGVERAFLAGEALHEQSCILIDEYAHSVYLARQCCDHFFARRPACPSRDREIEAGFAPGSAGPVPRWCLPCAPRSAPECSDRAPPPPRRWPACRSAECRRKC